MAINGIVTINHQAASFSSKKKGKTFLGILDFTKN